MYKSAVYTIVNNTYKLIRINNNKSHKKNNTKTLHDTIQSPKNTKGNTVVNKPIHIYCFSSLLLIYSILHLLTQFLFSFLHWMLLCLRQYLLLPPPLTPSRWVALLLPPIAHLQKINKRIK